MEQPLIALGKQRALWNRFPSKALAGQASRHFRQFLQVWLGWYDTVWEMLDSNGAFVKTEANNSLDPYCGFTTNPVSPQLPSPAEIAKGRKSPKTESGVLIPAE